MKYSKILLPVVMACLNFGCGASRIKQVWNASNTPVLHRGKIAVLVTVNPKDQALRDGIEEAMANHLCYLDYEAFSASRQYGPLAFNPENEENTVALMKRDGVEAIMTLTVLNWSVEKKILPQDLWCSPYNNYNRLFWCYQSAIQKKVNSPDYFERGSFMWEFNVYAFPEQQLMYCARTGNASLVSSTSNVDTTNDLFIADMVWRGILTTP